MKNKLAQALRADLPTLAQHVRKKGRRGDTVLAHISPREAKKLKEMGGSGTTNPHTGLPEYYEGGFEPDIGGGYEPVSSSYSSGQTYSPGFDFNFPAYSERGYDAPAYSAPTYSAPSAAPTQSYAPNQISPVSDTYASALGQYGPGVFEGEMPTTTGAAAGSPVEEPSAYQRAVDWLGRNKGWIKPAASLIPAAIGGYTALSDVSRARKSAQQYRQEMEKLAAPYRQQGQQLISSAQSGELTPMSQQAYQAAQARLAQQSANLGFVGNQQYATQLEALRAQLLQKQYDYGLAVMSVGDRIAQGAIKAGLDADTQVQDATQGFFQALGLLAGGVKEI